MKIGERKVNITIEGCHVGKKTGQFDILLVDAGYFIYRNETEWIWLRFTIQVVCFDRRQIDTI